jgi:hypothetical protein
MLKFWQISTLKKYDFDLYKGIFHYKKNAQFARFSKKNFPKFLDFYDKYPLGSQE